MSAFNARVASIVVLACVVSACAALVGLDRYQGCAHDCDGAGDGLEASAARDATDSDASSGSGLDGGEEAASESEGSPSGDGGGTAVDSGGQGGDASLGGDADSGVERDSGTNGDAGNAGDGASLCPVPTDIDGGLLVYYPFEGNAADRSGNANNGTATTGKDVSYGPGKIGQGVTILSGGHGVAVTGTTMLGAAKTLCAWVNPASGTSGGGLPVFAGGPTGAADLYDVASAAPADNCNAHPADSLFIDNWGTAGCYNSALTAVPGSWTFVCFEENGTTTTFFANGTSSTLSGSQYSYPLSDITVGSDLIGSSTTQLLFKGQLDEVSIWSGALSATDMTALYNGGSGCSIR
jgi:hypothetical protein